MSGMEFLCKVVGSIADNQKLFLDKQGKISQFRAFCDNLGIQIGPKFNKFTKGLDVVCCDPKLVKTILDSIPGTLTAKHNEFQKKCVQAIQKAKEDKTVKYESTLKLIKELFP